MKTKYYVAIFLLVALICGGLTLWLFGEQEQARSVEIWSDGKRVHTLSLSKNQTVTVTNGQKENVITIRDGAVAVTHANCPDGHCMQRGYCSGGAQIVCLPNCLVIKFVGKQEIDGMSG